MPDVVLESLTRNMAWWLDSASKVLTTHISVFFSLCCRLLLLPSDDETTEGHPINSAINHPVGLVTNALLHQWLRTEPKDDQGMPDELKIIFTSLCDVTVIRYRHARVLMTANTIALFRVDRAWTVVNLLPLFDWKVLGEEALGAWSGFLWSPRLYPPLFDTFKNPFLETARHYAELGAGGRQYAAILTYAAIDSIDSFTTMDFATATIALPQEGLLNCAQALVNALDSAGDQREQQWRNRIRPYWLSIWPKSRELVSSRIIEKLAQLSITARREFPSALETIFGWLRPLELPEFVVNLLWKSRLCSDSPRYALRLLDAIIDDHSWTPGELRSCLEAIEEAWPQAADDRRLRRLKELGRKAI